MNVLKELLRDKKCREMKKGADSTADDDDDETAPGDRDLQEEMLLQASAWETSKWRWKVEEDAEENEKNTKKIFWLLDNFMPCVLGTTNFAKRFDTQAPPTNMWNGIVHESDIVLIVMVLQNDFETCRENAMKLCNDEKPSGVEKKNKLEYLETYKKVYDDMMVGQEDGAENDNGFSAARNDLAEKYHNHWKEAAESKKRARPTSGGDQAPRKRIEITEREMDYFL